MRLKLYLQPSGDKPFLPFNYQYYLSAAIYKILSKASPEYSRFLHDKGYPSPSGRLMKLFTFSKIQIPHSFRIRDGLTTKDPRPWILYISSPMLQAFVQNFVLGLFDQADISLYIKGNKLKFDVSQVESLVTPEFGERIYCKTLSPIVVSTMTDVNERRQIHYFRPDEKGLPEAIEKNLQEKLGIIDKKVTQEEADLFKKGQLLNITFQPDLKYVKKRIQQGKRVTKKITIKPDTPEATEIISFEIPFWLKGDPKLMQVAWECGIGEHTSQGFGMMEVVRE